MDRKETAFPARTEGAEGAENTGLALSAAPGAAQGSGRAKAERREPGLEADWARAPADIPAGSGREGPDKATGLSAELAPADKAADEELAQVVLEAGEMAEARQVATDQFRRRPGWTGRKRILSAGVGYIAEGVLNLTEDS